MFVNRVSRRLAGQESEDLSGDWGKLHNEELLHNLYTLPSIIRINKQWRIK
jgi:hypothetical protein